MTSVKHVRKPVDEGSQETFRTLGEMKKNAADFQLLVKLAKAHSQATNQYIDTGKQLVDHLLKLSSKMHSRNSDLSEGLLGISAMEKTVFLGFEELSKSVDNELCSKLSKNLNSEHKETALFERDYKQKHNLILQAISKAEKESQKAGKKSAFQLQAAVQTISDKIAEMKEHRQSKLKQILLIERKKYCDFLTMWTAVVEQQVHIFESSHKTLSEQLPVWKELACNLDLTEESQGIVDEMALPERTSTTIDGQQPDDAAEGYYDEGTSTAAPAAEAYDESYSAGAYDEGAYLYNEGYEEEAYAEEGAYAESYGEEPYTAASGGVVTARALYDYEGTEDYELSFSAGTIITITNQDNESGWWTGEYDGKVGPFPGNYVELC